MTLLFAKQAKQVIGVEIAPQAIEDANYNAEYNKLEDKVDFYVGKTETVVPELYKNGKTADIVCVDPPRKGCDPVLINTILEMQPKKIVYVSCNPATLARDIEILEAGGYSLEKFQPIDVFPHTMHVETVAFMSRRQK